MAFDFRGIGHCCQNIYFAIIMKILVTGASGFVGSEIVSELVNRQFSIIALRKQVSESKNEQPNLERFSADIADYAGLEKLEEVGDVGVIIHSAGLAHQFGETKKEEFELINVQGTENVLRLAIKTKVRHFILIGSTAVYGIPAAGLIPTVITEATPVMPQTPYAESKLAAERICQKICAENNIALTIFRLAPVIGEANVGNVARLIRAIDKNRFIWIGDGGNLKSFIYKRDVARACVELIENKQSREEIFNLAARPVKLKDFVNKIATDLKRKLFPVAVPSAIPRLFFQINRKFLKIGKVSKLSETVEKWLSDDVYSGEKIALQYGFEPLTPIFEALSKQVKYYKENSRD